MILKALYDYYNRCSNLPVFGMEEKEIGFLLVIDKRGTFLGIEDCRRDKDSATMFLVRQHVGRTSAIVPNYLYDSAGYVFGYSGKDNAKDCSCLDAFKMKVHEICQKYPENDDLQALNAFYERNNEEILALVQSDPLWTDIAKSLTKRYAVFSFRIEGDTKIVAEKREILGLDELVVSSENSHICLVCGESGEIVETTTATMISGSQATAKLVSFQVNSGYDSYGKSKGFNAPISRQAEFAYTTALNTMLARGSHNKLLLGNRTFLFWASRADNATIRAEEALYNYLGFVDDNEDDPNARIEKVRQTFMSIYNGTLHTDNEDRFYILGLAPNSARIAVVYWSDTVLRDFACKILHHFDDMDIIDTRNHKTPYKGQKEILSAVTLGGKSGDATPNLPEAVVKSIFEGTPYPHTLLVSCIRRIRAEQDVMPYNNPCRVAIIKAYLNRLNDNNKKIQIMLDKENRNEGYLCGRLFAVLDKIQEDTYHINSIKERYLNSASATPSAVFATILNLSSHHSEKLNDGAKVFYEKLKQDIIAGLPADGFPAHLDLQDQGRFFVGYYHQRQDFFAKKDVNVTE